MNFDTIGNLVRKTEQCDPKSLNREFITYIDISSIDRETKRIVAPQIIPVDDAPSRARKKVRARDILVSTVRPNLNTVAYVQNDYDEEIASTGFCVLRPNEELLNSLYLFYFTQTERFVSRLTKLSTGANYPAVSDNEVFDTPIPLQSIPQQKRIAAILEKADRLRRRRRYAQQLSDRFLQSVFLKMFGDPSTNPQGWDMDVVEEILSKDRTGIRTGPFGSSLKRHEYIRAGIPVWGINNVSENEFIEEKSLYISESKYRELTNYTVQAGDILISRAGTVGRMCIARPKQSPSIIGTNLVRISLDMRLMIPEYFTSLFTYFPKRIGSLRMSGDDNAYSFLNPGILKTLLIPLPPLPLQQEFAQVVWRFERLRAQQREAERQAEHLFQTLLHRAFRGEL